jgi:hypothetical protein
MGNVAQVCTLDNMSKCTSVLSVDVFVRGKLNDEGIDFANK